MTGVPGDAVERAGFICQPGTWVSWSGERRFDAYGMDADGPCLGFQAPRDRLDSILLAAAVSTGLPSSWDLIARPLPHG